MQQKGLILTFEPKRVESCNRNVISKVSLIQLQLFVSTFKKAQSIHVSHVIGTCTESRSSSLTRHATSQHVKSYSLQCWQHSMATEPTRCTYAVCVSLTSDGVKFHRRPLSTVLCWMICQHSCILLNWSQHSFLSIFHSCESLHCLVGDNSSIWMLTWLFTMVNTGVFRTVPQLCCDAGCSVLEKVYSSHLKIQQSVAP